jgi:hypothetical protein
MGCIHYPLKGEKSMKQVFTLFGLVVFLGATAFAQGRMDEGERNVRIIQGPRIMNVTDHSARIEWVTNFDGANHVVYRVAGSNQEWQSAYHQGGGTRHFLVLQDLEPGRTYEWEILTRDGDVRKQGEFRTEGDRRHGHRDDRCFPGNDGGGYGGGNKVALYRAVDRSGAHLYYTDTNDQSRRNFRADGTAGYILDHPWRGTLGLHRLVAGNGDYLLTTDINDIPRMEALGYRDEGVIGFIASEQLPGTQPFYRLVKPDGSGHLFTASPQERIDTLRRGWRDEGTAGYIWLQ